MTRQTRSLVLEAALPRLGVCAPSDGDAGQWAGRLRGEVLDRISGSGFDAWSVAAARVGFCSRPVKLRGRATRIDRGTGEVLSSYSSSADPSGLTYVRCGNRRDSQCPSCARVYARDTFELVRAGISGGKSVPATVSANPLVFATLTAPSFGPVHGIRRPAGRCRPRDHAARCRHGRSVGCMAVHAEDDPVLGSPICPDCYDTTTHLVWQWWAPELWRRFTIAMRRLLARRLGVGETQLAEVAMIQYAKVAEYQARGAVHFHALVRLDGPSERDGVGQAPAGLAAADLARLVRDAARVAQVIAPPTASGDLERVLRFGSQLDVRPVRHTARPDVEGESLSAAQVAGYLAKYATKSAGDAGASSSAHHRHLRAVAGRIADQADPDGPYALMAKWIHMLGFRGHFSTKSRRCSTTLGALRRARRRWQVMVADARRAGCAVDTADLEARLLADDDHETTLVLGRWAYVGSGWDSEGDRELALAAADSARAYARWKAARREGRTTEERKDESDE